MEKVQELLAIFIIIIIDFIISWLLLQIEWIKLSVQLYKTKQKTKQKNPGSTRNKT